MKATLKFFGIIVLTAVIGFAMGGCDDGTGPNNNPPPPEITWELTQYGGELGVGGVPSSSTTAINITFSKEVTDLTDYNIIISGSAVERNIAPLSRNVNVWTVPVTVTTSESVSITVSKEGVAADTKTVMVYREGVKPPIDYRAEADGTEDSVTSTQITFAFDEAVNGLIADDITLTDGTGEATKVSLSGSGTIWTLDITVLRQGDIMVKITKSGITATQKIVAIQKKATLTTMLTLTDMVSFTNDSAYVYLMDDWAAGSAPVAAGQGTISNRSVIFSLIDNVTDESWVESGQYWIKLEIDSSEIGWKVFYYTNGDSLGALEISEYEDLDKLPKFTFDGTNKSIAFGLFREGDFSPDPLPEGKKNLTPRRH